MSMPMPVLTLSIVSIVIAAVVAMPASPAIALTVDCWPIRLDGTCLEPSEDRIRISSVAADNNLQHDKIEVRATLSSMVGNLTLAATYIVEVMDEEGFTVYIKEQVFQVNSGSSRSFSDIVNLVENGNLTIKFFVWSHDLEDPLPLLMQPAKASVAK